jgi:hypothetical protein
MIALRPRGGETRHVNRSASGVDASGAVPYAVWIMGTSAFQPDFGDRSIDWEW